jgi:hypothetical protein
MPIMRPCLDCHQLTRNRSRCEACEAKRQHHRNQARANYYDATYAKRAARVRATATNCWICGETAKPDDPWTADHVIPGDAGSPLLPAHRSCNARRGDAKGKRAEANRRMEKR